MSERPNQNWEARDYTKWGYKYGLDINNPQMNGSGSAVYQWYGYTDDKDVNLSLFSESGMHSLHNDRSIELVAGAKNSVGEVDIVIAGAKGDITLTCMENGVIRIKGANIMLQSDEDIDFLAGRNISFKGKNGGIKLDAQSVEANGLSGNVIEQTVGSWVQRVFDGSFVGPDDLISAGAVSALGQIPVVGSFVKSIF